MDHRRNLRILTSLAFSTLLTVLCIASVPKALAASVDQCTPCLNKLGQLSLLGHPQTLEETRPLVKGIKVRLGKIPGPNDPVLFVVSAADGPMPQLRDQIKSLGAAPHGMAAILMVNTARVDDAELYELVVREARELLSNYGVQGAESMLLLRDDTPNLNLIVRGIASVRCQGGKIIRK